MKSKASYIVIDTNVLISAGLLPESKTAHVLALAVEHFVIAQNPSQNLTAFSASLAA